MPIKNYTRCRLNYARTPRAFQTVVSREDITKQTAGEIAGANRSSAPAAATARAA